MVDLLPWHRRELKHVVSLSPLPAGLLRCILVSVIVLRPCTAKSFFDCGPSYIPYSREQDHGVCIFQLQNDELESSWDAGIIDGALHLTTDDVYQPPVYYPPDPTRRAGCAILREEVDLWRPACWSYENGELLLIYEYMPNGSVDKHLFHERQQHRGHQQPVLPWERRYDIVKDVAAGLHYVHHEYERTVLHRDIKASNIMLDSAFRGRLGDFGLARVVGFDKNSFTDVGVAGTWGFIAPEYPVSHKATRQTDVYAFGVLVLEVVTGRRSLGKADDEFPLLVDWAWWLHQEGRLLEAVDAELRASEAGFDADDAARLLLLGLSCSNPNPSDRPTLANVLQVVARTAPLPDVPLVKPAFVWPPEGALLDDDFIFYLFLSVTSRDDSRYWEEEETMPSFMSSEITKRRARNVDEHKDAGEIESYV
ncbi:hypothetical protein VPH35_032728 [Triticum aestivum]